MPVGVGILCGSYPTSGCWFETWLFLLMCLGKQCRLAQVVGFLTPTWETQREFLVSVWSSPHLLHTFGQWTSRWKISPPVTLSFTWSKQIKTCLTDFPTTLCPLSSRSLLLISLVWNTSWACSPPGILILHRMSCVIVCAIGRHF